MSEYGHRHRPPSGGGPQEPADPENTAVPGSNVEADREWARRRIANHLESQGISRKRSDTAERDASIPKSAGSPLPSDVRKRIEPSLDADLSSARIHTGADSAEAANQLGARAFTTGTDVHFGAGQYAPNTKEGDRLLVHELTHVVQGQRSGIQRKEDGGAAARHDEHEVSHPGEPAEQEADAVADKVTDDLHGPDKKDKHEQTRGAEQAHTRDHDGHVAGAERQGAHGTPSDVTKADTSRPNAGSAAVGASQPSVGRKISRKTTAVLPIVASQPSLGRKIFRAAVPATPHDTKKAAPSTTPPSTATDIKEACHKKGGAAAQIVAQLEHEVQIDADTKKKLFTAAAALFAAKGGDPVDAIQATLKGDAESYLCRGRDITLEAVRQEGGINRVVDLPSVFKYYLQDDIKDARFQSDQDRFLDGAAAGKFDPYSHMREEALLQGWAPLTWWSAGPPLPGGADMGKIMKTIHVDNPSYKDGGVRLDLSPDDFAKAMKEHGLKIYKPTAFDGAFQVSGDGKSALFNQDKDGSQIWGITKGGAKEAVMKPVPIKVFKRRTLLVPPRPKATADGTPKPPAPPHKGKKA